ncbi:MAG: YraN family protein [Thiothrix sp.]|nr:MAG: YraN family protein [Thiothrix sp.]
MKNQLLGNKAEQRALKYLLKQGLKHLESNFRSRYGEIDLILQDQETLVFVEVRYRKRQEYGGAASSVDRHKQRKLIKTGLTYLQKHSPEAICRFDIVAIQDKGPLEWIQNAFDSDA